LLLRIISALILAPLVILGIWTLSPPHFSLAILLVTLIGAWEWAQFTQPLNRFSSFCILAGAIVPSILLWQVQLESISLYMGLLWWLISIILVITFPKSAFFWQKNVLLKLIAGWLVLLPFAFSMIALRSVNTLDMPNLGRILILLVCALVWGADSGAYFVGRTCGKHKMAPNVSPKKTLEGLFGGVVTALILGYIVLSYFDIHFATPAVIAMMICLTVIISVFGDLVESMFKRVAQIKDSGKIIPGHGGILDRIDSLTAAFPVFTLLYFLFH